MEFIECLEGRRSVRVFKNQPVPESALREMVRRASYAPSWKNTQSVRWLPVSDRAVLSALAAGPALGYPGNKAILESCPLLMAETCINGRSGYERDGSFSTSRGDRWEMFDAGVAAQSFCLAAWDLGYGTVIMGDINAEQTAKILGLAEGRSVSCLIAVGLPDQEPVMPRRKSVDDLLS